MRKPQQTNGDKFLLRARIAAILNLYLGFREGRLIKIFSLFMNLENEQGWRRLREAISGSVHRAPPI